MEISIEINVYPAGPAPAAGTPPDPGETFRIGKDDGSGFIKLDDDTGYILQDVAG